MPEHPSDVRTDAKPHRSLFERLTALISPEPENRVELLEVLHDAHGRNLIDADALSMIEGVFQVSDLSARDIMVPRSQMDVIDISRPIESWMPQVLATAHSRFPAVEGDRDRVVGILLAKDLLRYYAEESFDVRDMLRPAVFIPESKLPRPPGAPSPLALITGSGAFAVAKGNKFSDLQPVYTITIGNQMDLTAADDLEALAGDDRVEIFALYLEGFRPRAGSRERAGAPTLAVLVGVGARVCRRGKRPRGGTVGGNPPCSGSDMASRIGGRGTPSAWLR